MMGKETYTPWDSAELLDDEETIVEYLKAALEANEPELFVKAVGTVARATGMTAIAHETHLGRQNLYKALSGERNPRIDTVMKVLDALGVQLTVAPKGG
ncbi:MAG: putative addiction module antidote protein [Nitrospira sp.]|nr:putative addiction module antidote protein [Nitrospira sp.]MCY4131736.1 putative addiction module antidote protein [Nitrospira sp.]